MGKEKSHLTFRCQRQEVWSPEVVRHIVGYCHNSLIATRIVLDFLIDGVMNYYKFGILKQHTLSYCWFPEIHKIGLSRLESRC